MDKESSNENRFFFGGWQPALYLSILKCNYTTQKENCLSRQREQNSECTCGPNSKYISHVAIYGISVENATYPADISTGWTG